jgi:hypothetical protein
MSKSKKKLPKKTLEEAVGDIRKIKQEEERQRRQDRLLAEKKVVEDEMMRMILGPNWMNKE